MEIASAEEVKCCYSGLERDFLGWRNTPGVANNYFGLYVSAEGNVVETMLSVGGTTYNDINIYMTSIIITNY